MSMPNPKGKSGFVSDLSARRGWLLSRGHEKESLPLAGAAPKSTSATPDPSVPGSHAATRASIMASSGGGMQRGRPQTATTTTRREASARRRMRLASLEQRVRWRMHRSPAPSAYGASPTTTTATRSASLTDGISERVLLLRVLLLPAWLPMSSLPGQAALMPCHIVSPVVALLPRNPCHSMLQPPHCIPKSSAAAPHTSGDPAGSSGRMPC
mmetsp:Transcript_29091/g.65889  ORF Transcript_29091/g.65889 Transcript_29091/m.65889 type:complete len:212 (+) Transcript_29091:377-1012(+)